MAHEKSLFSGHETFLEWPGIAGKFVVTTQAVPVLLSQSCLPLRLYRTVLQTLLPTFLSTTQGKPLPAVRVDYSYFLEFVFPPPTSQSFKHP